MAERLNYEESCRFLQQNEWLKKDDIPKLPEQPPQYDDEELGVSFFRTLVEDALFDNLTLPRTYFGRSEIKSSSFVGSDLTESVANWNDFINVDFSRADLSKFDFRGCSLQKINFTGSILKDADLRCCGFEDCSFEGADMAGVKMTKEAGTSITLTEDQREVIDWHDDDGPEPGGG
jgi:BTB/POZ domain-containing protein KCTD9